jgi:hypothetical protein
MDMWQNEEHLPEQGPIRPVWKRTTDILFVAFFHFCKELIVH